MPQRRPKELDSELSAYLDGELPAQQRQEVESYLAASPAARQRLAELRAVAASLGALPRLRAPEELSAALARHAEHRVLWGEPSAKDRGRIIRASAQLAAAAAVLLIGVLVGRHLFAPAPLSTPHALPAGQPPQSLEADNRTPIAHSPASLDDREQVSVAGRGLTPVARPAAAPDAATGDTSTSVQAREHTGPIKRESALANELAMASLGTLPTAASEPAATHMPISPPTSDVEPEPLIIVSVTPQDAIEYLGTGLLLATWMTADGAARFTGGATSESRAAPAEASLLPSAPAPVELTWRLDDQAAAERLRRLIDTAGRQRVHLQTSFGPDDSFVVNLVARALSNEPGSSADVSTRSLSSQATVLARQPPPSLPETLSTDATKELDNQPSPPQALTTGGERPVAQSAQRRREPRGVLPPRKGFDDRRTPEQIRADMEAQLQAATAEPELEIVRVPPPGEHPSQPIPTEAVPAPAATRPQGEPVERHVFFERLLALLFPSPTDLARALSTAEPTGARTVRLRVRLLPPQEAMTPASRPTAAGP